MESKKIFHNVDSFFLSEHQSMCLKSSHNEKKMINKNFCIILARVRMVDLLILTIKQTLKNFSELR